MLRFAANITYLFREAPFLDRFGLAADAGFSGVEFHFPYEHRPEDIASAASAAGLRIVQTSVASGDLTRGEWGIAALPDEGPAFRTSLRRTLNLACFLGIEQVHAPAGIVGPQIAWHMAWETYLDNLHWAAAEAERKNLWLLIEPINDRDTPHYFIPRTALARRAIEAIGAANIFLQIDCYHCAALGEDPIEILKANRDLLRHVQISGYPGRHEPDSHQTINYGAVFETLRLLDYGGWIGCEYRPRTTARDGLAWMNSSTPVRA